MIPTNIAERIVEPVMIGDKPYYVFQIGSMKEALRRINLLFSKKKIRGWKNKERIWGKNEQDQQTQTTLHKRRRRDR